MHCMLIPINGKQFKGKQVYTCQSCGLTLGLEDPNTKIICKVEASKHDVTELLTKKQNDSYGNLTDDVVDIPKGATLREQVEIMTRDRMRHRAREEGKIADNKDNTMAELIIDKKAKDYAEHYVSRKEQGRSTKEDMEKFMCTQEEINGRLAICDTCEYYENEQCLQCGCAVSRNAVHSNKLAHKNKSCPINKWGPIPIQTPANGEGDNISSEGDSSDSG